MADIGKAPEGFPRLMQAARALAGLTIDGLAEKVADEDGLSARSLRDVESGKRLHLAPSKRRAIMDACDLPAAMLAADFWWLEDIEQGLDGLPDYLLVQRTPQELIRESFRLLAEHERVVDQPVSEGSEVTLGELQTRLETMETKNEKMIERLEAAFEAAQQKSATQAAVDASRLATQAAKGAVGPAETETEAAPNTHDEEDANAEAPQPRREANQ